MEVGEAEETAEFSSDVNAIVPDVPLVVALSVALFLSTVLHIVLVIYSFVSLQKVLNLSYLLVYIIFLGFSFLIQSLWEVYMIIGHSSGMWIPDDSVGACVVVSVISGFSEALPCLLITSLAADLSGGVRHHLRRRRNCLRASFMCILPFVVIFLIDSVIFVNTVIYEFPPGSRSYYCVPMPMNRRHMMAIRYVVLFFFFLVPLLVTLTLHLCKILKPANELRRLGIISFACTLVRWTSWFPMWAHNIIIDTLPVEEIFSIVNITALYNSSCLMVAFGAVIEGALFVLFVRILREREIAHLHSRRETLQRLQRETAC